MQRRVKVNPNMATALPLHIFHHGRKVGSSVVLSCDIDVCSAPGKLKSLVRIRVHY